jgi:hypothetical protein
MANKGKLGVVLEQAHGRRNLSALAVWIIAVALAVLGLATLWLGGEMHYRNCQQDWSLDRQAARESDFDGEVVFGDGPVPHDCSRLPI